MNSEKKSKRRGKRQRLFAALLAVVCLAGCGSRQVMEEEKKTSIRVVYSDGDVRWTGCMEWAAEQFMAEHPDILVELYTPHNLKEQNYMDRLKAMIAQDEFYDVVELREADKLAVAGYLAPLPKEVTALVQQEQQIGSPVYAVPRYTTTLGMIYNRTIFEKEQLTEPDTYEEFWELLKQLQTSNRAAIAAGGAELWHMNFWGNYLYGNYIVDANGEVKWTQKRTERMLSDFRKLAQQNAIAKKYQSMSDSQTAEELSSGRAVMLYSGPWMLAQIKGLNPQMELGFFYLPGADGKTYVLEDNSITWGISSSCQEDSRRMEAASQFLQFYYSEGIYEKILSDMNAESVTIRQIKDRNQWQQNLIQDALRPSMIKRSQFIGDANTPDGFRTYYDQLLRETLWGSESVEMLAEKLVKRWEEGHE